MSYFSRLQMDVVWFLKLKYRKVEIEILKEDIDFILHQIIERTIRGDQGYFSIFDFSELSNNPFSTISDWCMDIVDYIDNTNLRKYFWKRYKVIMERYFDIDEINNKHEFIKHGKNLQEKRHISIDEFKKYCLFDAESMYKKGILNVQILNDYFDHSKKYYMVNHFNPCVYGKAFTYDELLKFLEDKYDYCTIPQDDIISIDYISIEEAEESYANYIVCEDYFENMKSVDEYLSSVNFKVRHLDALLYDLKSCFDDKKVLYHLKKFYDLSSAENIKKYGEILKSGNVDNIEKFFDLLCLCFTYQERVDYLKEIDDKLGNGNYFTKKDWFEFGRYLNVYSSI